MNKSKRAGERLWKRRSQPRRLRRPLTFFTSEGEAREPEKINYQTSSEINLLQSKNDLDFGVHHRESWLALGPRRNRMTSYAEVY
jgi:hypothetical protein